MAKKRGGLGRGIGALIPSAAPAQAAPATTPAKDEASTAPAQAPEVSASEPTPSANKTSATRKKPAQKSATAKSSTAKSSAQESPAKKAPAKKTSTQKASPQEASTQQTSAPKASAKKTPATKTSTTRKPGTQASSKPAASSSSTSRASASTTTSAGTAPSQDAAPEARPAKAATTRPVDMFFSAESSTGAQSSRARTHLADDWARDTQSKRRTATKKPRRGSAAKAGTSTKEFDSAVEVEAAQPVSVTDTVEAPVTELSDTNAAAAIDDPTQPSTPATDESPAVEDSAAAEETVEAEAPAPEAIPATESDASPSEETDGDRPSTEDPQTTGSAAQSRDDRDDEDFEGQELLTVPGAQFAEVPINEIRENPRNPRTVFDDDELNELAYSLQEVGVLQPIVIRPITGSENGESFELVMGERRWRAAKRAGLASIPAIIRDTTDDDLLRDALLENLHRTQLNPLEEAAAYGQLLEDFGCTQDELSDKIGRSRPQISNTLRLLRLPPLVQRRLASGAISAGHARALLGLDDAQLQEELAQRIVNEGLSVRAVERLIANGVSPSSGVRSAAPRRTSYNPHVVDMTSKLSNRLETPVRIDVGKRKGKITVEFTNLDDLDRLMERLGLDVE